jgi:2-keto-4-pentenoate hydratase
MDTPTIIADDFFGAGCVLGPEVKEWRSLDPSTIKGAMDINGEVVGTGVGSDIMGHPLQALAWLANLMASRGTTLRAGQFVLLGSVVETHWVEQGDVVNIELEGLGKAVARFV